jgi:carbonic anhydrase/acetyltransferase-like protein (isoleucine patch superfamily)
MGGAMCAAHRRSEVPVAPPSALPRRPGRRDRWRLRAARRRGVEAGAGVTVGRGVVFDVAAGGRVVLGDGAALGDGSRLHVGAGAVVVLGAGTRLGERCAITAQERVTIGARCLLGDEVVLIDAEPRTDDVERPVREQGLRTAPVVVGDDVRIGPSAALLAGARVADGASVGAHETVTPDPKAAAAAQGRAPGGPVRRPAASPSRPTGPDGVH